MTRSPLGTQIQQHRAQVLGDDSESEGAQEAWPEVLAEHSTEDSWRHGSVRWGTMTRRTHCRKGEAGYDVLINKLTGGTLRSQTVSLTLCQLSEQAKQCPERVFSTLHHLIDVDFLREAYGQLNKKAAPGVDEVTAESYAENLETNLEDLYQRYRSGQYTAPPVKRIWIDKEDATQRPIGITAFEDKILQKAVAMLLGAIYEIDFYDFSYGFREQRSAHDAIDALRKGCYQAKVSVIIDADIEKFFDAMTHQHIRDILQLRINDGKIMRFIGKWLNAGVMEKDNIHYPACGSPQGSVLSPLIANILLHHVLDTWYVEQVKPQLEGGSFLIRFADDFVLGCESETDAHRLMAVLPKRFAKFELNIHPTKSKMIAFKWPSKYSATHGNGTFDFLGFTHYWARSRQGNWVIKRKTIGKRQRRALRNLFLYCRHNRQAPVKEQHQQLSSKLRGLYNYYGIRSNYRCLEAIYEGAKKSWKMWLGRRTREGYISWEKFHKFIETWILPVPRITKMV